MSAKYVITFNVNMGFTKKIYPVLHQGHIRDLLTELLQWNRVTIDLQCIGRIS